MYEPKDDPIPAYASAVLALFQEDLRKVRFPDLDHDSLASAAEELKAAQLEVECVEAALVSARELVRERARVLAAQAQRGLSYARVFAHGNASLSARVAQIDRLAADPAGTAATPNRKKGRARKEHADAELFASETDSASSEEAAA